MGPWLVLGNHFYLSYSQDRFDDVTKGRGARGGEKVNLGWVGPITSRPFDCKCLYFVLKVKGKGEGGGVVHSDWQGEKVRHGT